MKSTLCFFSAVAFLGHFLWINFRFYFTFSFFVSEVRLVNVLIDLCSALSQLDEGIGKDRCDFTDDIYVTVRKIFECELQIRIEDIGDLFTFIVTIVEHNTNSS